MDRPPFRQGPLGPSAAPVGSGGVQILHPAGRRSWLRAWLIALDVAVVAVAWVVSASAVAGDHGLALAGLTAAAGAGGTLAAVAAQRLYRSRVCSIRTLEIQALGRAVLAGGAAAFASAEFSGLTPRPLAAIASAVAAGFVGLVAARGGYRAWLANRRRSGWYARDVVLIGANEEATELHRITRDHPEMGYRVVGFIGPPAASDALDAPWLGDYDQAVEATRQAGASGALLVATAMLPGHLNGIARGLLEAGVHVQISSGLRGIAARRLTTLPLAHEPLLYVEPIHLLGVRLAVKRAFDVVFASALLISTMPVLLLAALAIKLEDGGPVFFPQTRLGRHERPFTLYKLRTMVPDAEKRLAGLHGINEHTDGPLFKASPDPRVTRIGGLLRAS
ncbi:MAG TPA: sugar transferase, partial [Egibacteraceae bacterium]|nr:sugar transferase [Egibacteraceae bacterium]